METKKVRKYFSIMQYRAEEEYLRKMSLSGWKLTRVSGFCVYHFERCEPADVVYRLDYNRDGIEHKEEYVQMFRDCGWEYVQDYVGYSYFRRPAAQQGGDDEIFCDEESRLEMMSRVFQTRLVPLLVFLFAFALPQFALNLYHGRAVLACAYGAILGLYLILFLWFAVEYGRFQRNVGK